MLAIVICLEYQPVCTCRMSSIVDSFKYNEDVKECSWHLFQDTCGILWPWEESTEEWFYIDCLKIGWQRYVYCVGYHRNSTTLFLWWHHAADARWFMEPSSCYIRQTVCGKFAERYFLSTHSFQSEPSISYTWDLTRISRLFPALKTHQHSQTRCNANCCRDASS